MSRPDLCFATSSLRKSLSSRCRFSIASSTVKRGRTPRNSATSPRQVFRSTMIVGRLVSRASSTPQLTATVVVPAPPLAPRNACVTHGGLAPAVAASRRAAVRRTAPWNDSFGRARRRRAVDRRSRGRTRWRRRASPGGSGPARRPPRSTKIARLALLARSRSIAAMPDEASARMSTTTRSGPCPSALRPSTMPTGTPQARSRREICRLNSSS